MNQFIKKTLSLTVALAMGLVASEITLRIKNQSMLSYPIEMWRYSKELKIQSRDPILGHEHVRSKCSVLQRVQICLNEFGLRGASLQPRSANRRRILFLGDSVALGWGVPESETLPSRVASAFHEQSEDVELLNAGVGNYNAVRYVRLFLTRLVSLKPTDIVVEYFPRDAQTLGPGRGNWLLRHSELAVILDTAYQGFFRKHGADAVDEDYLKDYDPHSAGFENMRAALGELARYAKQNNIRLYLAMVPDVRRLESYKLRPIHSLMGEISKGFGYKYVDLLPALENLRPEEAWNMPGDPHPNGFANERMARVLFPAIQLATPDSRLTSN